MLSGIWSVRDGETPEQVIAHLWDALERDDPLIHVLTLLRTRDL